MAGMFVKRLLTAVVSLLAVFAVAALAGTAASAAPITVLHSFNGADGEHPAAGVIADSAGNLYGSTVEGGTSIGNGSLLCSSRGCGTIFKLAPDGTHTVLYNFAGDTDRAGPMNLIADKDGNLYGTAAAGGGIVFKLAPDGVLTALHSSGVTDLDAFPYPGVIADNLGNLYGTASPVVVGSHGTVFKIAPDGTFTVLHRFTAAADGSSPNNLILDGAGNIYGTTGEGGGTGCYPSKGCGTVFKLAPDGTEAILYRFSGGADGQGPIGRLTIDSTGTLYGTTVYGGTLFSGTIFKLAPDGTKTTLYNFPGHFSGTDGAYPASNLIRDTKGNFYGSTSQGGKKSGPSKQCGTLFRLTPTGVFKTIHRFTRPAGCFPHGNLILDKSGKKLIGTTSQGGANDLGVVFSVPHG